MQFDAAIINFDFNVKSTLKMMMLATEMSLAQLFVSRPSHPAPLAQATLLLSTIESAIAESIHRRPGVP